jgi:hypothetical protein
MKTEITFQVSSMYDGMNVDVIDKNVLSIIMGQIVAMETGAIATVSHRLFRYDMKANFQLYPTFLTKYHH